MNPHKVDALGLVAALAILAGSYFGFLRGNCRELREVRHQRDETWQRASEKPGLLAELDRAHETLQPLRKAADRARAALANPGDVDQFLRQLATTAEASNVNMRLLRPGALVATARGTYLPINVVAVADFAQLHLFFTELEHTNQLATVEQMTISNDDGTDTCRASVTLRLHLPAQGGRI